MLFILIRAHRAGLRTKHATDFYFCKTETVQHTAGAFFYDFFQNNLFYFSMLKEFLRRIEIEVFATNIYNQINLLYKNKKSYFYE